MSRDPFEPENEKFKFGDLVRYTDPERPNQPSFWRVFRVHQSWLELRPGKRIGDSGGNPMKYDCELVAHNDVDVDFGFVALPHSQLKRLWRLADAAGDPVAAVLHAELERVERLWAQPAADAC